MNVAVLVPRRVVSDHRERLWAFTRPLWAQHGQVVEGHHNDGPFNRGAAINTAAREAGKWDVALIVDGDVVVPPDQITAAIERAAETGRATFAFVDYRALNQRMTERALDGYDGAWDSGATLRLDGGRHVSSCMAVPRALWDEVGGFDERFVGWGHDDIAFTAACRVLGGGIERIPGRVWHLWHPTGDATAAKRTAAYAAGAALSSTYQHTVDPDGMRQLVAASADVCLMVMTDGRRDTIDRCLPVALEQLKGADITHRIIHDDSGDPEYAAWLRLRFPGFDVHTVRKRSGFGGAMVRARDLALATGAPWTFWLEDDFMLERPVDLGAIQDVMAARPHLVQMALRRQAWFPGELAAGGVIEQHPDAYEDHDTHLEHELFFTTNPALIPRAVLAEPWSTRPHSEARFSREILTGGRRAGYWGSRNDDPWVTHCGERSGTGY